VSECSRTDPAALLTDEQRARLDDLMSYDVLLHNRCGRTLAEHPYPHASGLGFGCTFPALPDREFRRVQN